jgi:hypothetical protein
MGARAAAARSDPGPAGPGGCRGRLACENYGCFTNTELALIVPITELKVTPPRLEP